jgi:hypothetical protein
MSTSSELVGQTISRYRITEKLSGYRAYATLTLLLLTLTAATYAQSFKPYPGSTKYTPPDNAETRQAMKNTPAGTTSTVYTTGDSFDKVVAFYKASATQYDMPHHTAGKLPNGQELQQTFMIFDGAANLMTSKKWAKIQHPFIGSVTINGTVPEYKDIRDLTEISFVEKK